MNYTNKQFWSELYLLLYRIFWFFFKLVFFKLLQKKLLFVGTGGSIKFYNVLAKKTFIKCLMLYNKTVYLWRIFISFSECQSCLSCFQKKNYNVELLFFSWSSVIRLQFFALAIWLALRPRARDVMTLSNSHDIAESSPISVQSSPSRNVQGELVRRTLPKRRQVTPSSRRIYVLRLKNYVSITPALRRYVFCLVSLLFCLVRNCWV